MTDSDNFLLLDSNLDVQLLNQGVLFSAYILPPLYNNRNKWKLLRDKKNQWYRLKVLSILNNIRHKLQ